MAKAKGPMNYSKVIDPDSGWNILAVADDDYGYCGFAFGAYYEPPESVVLDMRLDVVWYVFLNTGTRQKLEPAKILDYYACELLRRYRNTICNNIFLIDIPDAASLLRQGRGDL